MKRAMGKSEPELTITRRTFAVAVTDALGAMSLSAANRQDASDPAQSVRLILPAGRTNVVDNIARLFERKVRERCPARVITHGKAAVNVELALQPGIGSEGFAISDGEKGAVRIAGNDERGLLFGVGKFLRTSRCKYPPAEPGALDCEPLKAAMRGR